MTVESSTALAAADVLAAAKGFFAGSRAVHPAWIETESPTHVSFSTFRSNIVVSALPDPERDGRTRVRVSSLRDRAAVNQFLAFLESLPAGHLRRDQTASAST